MSKVRLIDIYNERFNEPSLKLSATADIEVVPRKMVEMIIERLKRNISSCENDSYAGFTLTDVLQYAESLLKQFEE